MSRPSRRRIRREPRGYILFLMMVFIPLLGMVSMLAMDRTVGEVLSAGRQARDKKAFFRADGGAAICRRELINRLGPGGALPTRMGALTSLSSVPTDPIDLLVNYAYLSGVSFGGTFVKDGSQARISIPYPASNPTYNCTLNVASRGAMESLGLTTRLYRYRYVIEGDATEGGVTRQVTLEGTFSMEVQQTNTSFARYALFTNCQKEGSCATGNPIWFMGLTRFTGPVHTNGQFNFWGNPAGQFTALADSVSKTAQFYHSREANGDLKPLDADSYTQNPDSKQWDVPSFGGGFQRGSDNIPMPSATDADYQRAKALGGASAPSSNGVYPGAKDTNGDGKPDTMTGGIYVKGDASVAVGVGGSGIAQYTITVGTTSYTVRVNYGTKQTSVQVGGGTPTTYTGLPNGDGQLMLFVDGAVKSLGGTLQRDSQVTIAATADIQITDHLRYENYTAGSPPSAEGTANILGLISWTGDVRISDLAKNNPAPNDITIHATVMTPDGEFRVDGYDTIKYRGTATVLGGVIENTYGQFGRYDINTGYGRNFVFDSRMGRGMAPPFFPTTAGGGVSSTVAGINDRPNWQQTN